jgi:hypothetical protein
VTSGRLAAEAILDRTPASYPTRLAEHPLLADYRRVYRVVEVGRSVRGRKRTAAPKSRALADRAVARGFAWMFSGKSVPAPRVVDFILDRIVKDRRPHAAG